MKRFVPDRVSAPAIFVPDTSQKPKYIVQKVPGWFLVKFFDRWQKFRKGPRKRNVKSFLDLERADIRSLRSNGQIKFKIKPSAKSFSLGIVASRKKLDLFVYQLGWLRETPLIIKITPDHPGWRNYNRWLIERKLKRIEAAVKRSRFLDFLRQMREGRKNWLWSDSEFNAEISLRAHQQKLDKMYKVIMAYRNLLNQLHRI